MKQIVYPQHTNPHAHNLANTGRTLFWSQLRRRPYSIRALAPSSQTLARAMASCLPQNAHRVLEFGAGTGALTWGLLNHGIHQENLALIEPNPLFADHLRRTFPRARVIEGYAQDIEPTGDWDAVVSGLPVLSFPIALQKAILHAAKGALVPGAPLIQFTYGPRCPYRTAALQAQGFTAHRGPLVLWNVPPARIWILTSH